MAKALVTIALAAVTLLSALQAAWLWWSASRRTPRLVTHVPGSEGHVVQIEDEATNASLLNAQAALWSGATAVLSALTAIWGSLGPILIA